VDSQRWSSKPRVEKARKMRVCRSRVKSTCSRPIRFRSANARCSGSGGDLDGVKGVQTSRETALETRDLSEVEHVGGPYAVAESGQEFEDLLECLDLARGVVLHPLDGGDDGGRFMTDDARPRDDQA
jgi:hypothetical protein